MLITNDVLERICKNVIETILACLGNATKGTIYRIGPMPELRAVRVTSGIRLDGTDRIEWGLPQASDYNFPGKAWEQYKDKPGHVLEALGWCVERQKSWTADDPMHDQRSVRKQLRGELEDCSHMEPVLVRKRHLCAEGDPETPLALDYGGQPIWGASDYVVAAVVKIHFKPNSLRRGDQSTQIVKKLAHTLGTELLSFHVRETMAEAQRELERQRLQSCNQLAHELRNTLIKLGLVFPAINAELGFLRDQWEREIERAVPGIPNKRNVVARLKGIIESGRELTNGNQRLASTADELLAALREFGDRPCLPAAGRAWVDHKIRPRWGRLLRDGEHIWGGQRDEILALLESLDRAVELGMDKDVARRVTHLPEDLRTTWPKLAYVDFTADKVRVLDEVLSLLNHPELDIPHRWHTRKILTALKGLVEIMPEVEERTNRVISSLRNGCPLDDSEDLLHSV